MKQNDEHDNWQVHRPTAWEDQRKLSTDMTQLDPAGGFKRGSTLEAEGRRALQAAAQFLLPVPCLCQSVSGQGLFSPGPRRAPSTLQRLTISPVNQYMGKRNDTACGFLIHYQKQHKNFKYIPFANLLGYREVMTEARNKWQTDFYDV